MMENHKKKEWIKLLGAFTLGALLMLALTGAGGALWQGKFTTAPSAFTLEETIVTAGECATTNCDLATQLGTVSSALEIGISGAQISLADQIDMVSHGLVTLIRDTCH